MRDKKLLIMLLILEGIIIADKLPLYPRKLEIIFGFFTS